MDKTYCTSLVFFTNDVNLKITNAYGSKISM